jgi:hypothetical protein
MAEAALPWLSKQLELFETAYQAGHWADLSGNWLVIGGLSIAIVVWATIAAIRLHAGVRRFCRAIDLGSVRVATTPAKAREFASSYETVAATFGKARVIGRAWRDWSATIIVPATSGIPVRSTSRPETYFSLGILRDCRINPRLHAAMPTLLVSVGLLLTFVGLAIALTSADVIADLDVTPSVRRGGLRTLLDVASVKSVTSLVGLFSSILYAVFRGRELDRAERALDGFLTALEERIPLATPAILQAESNTILEKLFTAQSTSGDDLAVRIGRLFDNALNHRLEEHIYGLHEAIEQLSESIGTKSQDTLRTSLEEFRTMLQGSAQTYMEKLADAVVRISEGMEQIRSGLTEAASRMASAADQMSHNAEQVTARITLQLEGSVGELRTLVEHSRNVGTEAMAEAARRIADAGDSFGLTARAMATSLEQMVQGIAARLSGEAEVATRRTTEELTNAIAAMRSFAEQNRSAGDDAIPTMAGRVWDAAADFERSTVQVAELLTVSTSGEEMASDLSTAAPRMNDGAGDELAQAAMFFSALEGAMEPGLRRLGAGGRGA